MQTRIRILNQNELEGIHEKSLYILANTGMRIDTHKGRTILLEAGAIQKNANILTFSTELVEKAIQSVPRQFMLGGRRDGWSFQVNCGDNTLCLDGEGTMVIDPESNEVRPALYRDWLDITRLADYCDEVGIYWSMVTAADGGNSMAEFVDTTAATFRNFSKHVQDPFVSADQAPWFLEILQTIFGDRETIINQHPYSTLLCPQSPLILEAEYTDAYLALEGWNIPVAVMPMALMGATAPASMLGTLIQCNCEVLATLCLIQANEPGTPFIYAPALTLMDPRTGRYFCGGVENAVMNSAAIELARFYGFPVMGSGFGSDVFKPSTQGGYERAMNTLLPLLAWPDILIGPGLLGGDMILSMDQFMADLEIYRMSKQIRRGISTEKHKWLEKVIEVVGPGGNYLMEETTIKAVRGSEWYLPQLGAHDSYETWLENGSKSLADDIKQELDRILASHRPLPLPEEVEKELAQIRSKSQGV